MGFTLTDKNTLTEKELVDIILTVDEFTHEQKSEMIRWGFQRDDVYGNSDRASLYIAGLGVPSFGLYEDLFRSAKQKLEIVAKERDALERRASSMNDTGEKLMSGDTLSSRVAIACAEANEVIYRISDVTDFIEWAIKDYNDLPTYSSVENARKNTRLAARKAQETSNMADLVQGYEKLAETCKVVANRIKEDIKRTSFRSLVPFYETFVKDLLEDAKKYTSLATKQRNSQEN